MQLNWLFSAALLAFVKGSMAKRYHICYLEPLLACILACIHAALARASKIKGLDHVRSTFLQYCGSR